ncbi:hypothetical protein [Caulobacter sp.]|uniref:hypothetical protein n=1 Tax=Caulobacter sp. TaxID=78 RepID=UPI003BAEE238
MPWRDPEIIGRYLMTVAGACLYGFYLVAIQLQSGQPLTLRDGWRVLAHAACSIACGLILTFVFAERITGFIPWPSLRDAGLLAFAFGVFGFELLPLAFKSGRTWAEKQAGKVGEAP